MFMGPLEATKPWSMAGVNGVRKLPGPRLADDRRRQAEAWQLTRRQDVEPTDEQNRVLHRTIMASRTTRKTWSSTRPSPG
jgi:leucyl-tRNA synthetase